MSRSEVPIAYAFFERGQNLDAADVLHQRSPTKRSGSPPWVPATRVPGGW